MTYIKKELEFLDRFGLEHCLNTLKQEQEEIKEKIHILKVISLAQHLEGLIDNHERKILNITHFQLDYFFHPDYDKFTSDFKFKIKGIEHPNLQTMENSDQFNTLYIETGAKIRAFDLDKKLFNKNYDGGELISFDKKSIERFKMSLLNDRLQKTLLYATLDHTLEENIAVKKMKI